MLFNSFVFAVFFVLVYSLYLLLRRHHRAQNYLLLIASYVFYGYWDWRFLSLLAVSTLIDYSCGLRMKSAGSPALRKAILIMSMIANLGILGFFKYFDFFSQSTTALLNSVGWHVEPFLINVVLPVGISFYTFQTMSYTIDIYRRQMEPTDHLLDFALYVSFFPQLVAGPIERAKQLLPQILDERVVTRTKIYTGGWLLFWGLYKKVFVADNLARFVDPVFADTTGANGWMVLLATYAFTFQIYCDFSGYTDIARGIARMMGFELSLNFNLPYFAISPADFWRRWHISLSMWLRDYLYIPLGGNQWGTANTLRNLMITMALGGLWHGARWNMVAWGLYYGALLVIWRVVEGEHKATPATRFGRFIAILGMFHLTCLGWTIFRVDSLADWTGLAGGLLTRWDWPPGFDKLALSVAGYMALLVALEFAQFWRNDIDLVERLPGWVRVMLYMVIYFSLTIGGAFDARQFIYFQF